MDEVAAKVLARIRSALVVPVLRMGGPADVERAASRLVDGGVELIEIAATTPGWLDALRVSIPRHPGVTFGVGTIRTLEDGRAALDCGAEFLVCPYLAPSLRESFGGYLIEGGFTPGEIAQAGSSGLAKLFPSHAVEPSYLKSILAVLPDVSVMPTGGLSIDRALDWLRQGAVAVGVGASIVEHPAPGKVIAAIREASDGF